MGRLVCQLARASTHNAIYVKQGLISIRGFVLNFKPV